MTNTNFNNSSMLTITIHYTCKYTLKNNTNYVFTICGLCYNTKSGRIVKQVLKSNCIGYIIEGKFKSLTFLKTQLTKIKINKLPF